LARGVASGIRASQLPVPLTIVRGEKAHLFDIDGNRYLDFALAYGPALLGHSPRPVLEAVRRQLDSGLGFGASHSLETELSEAVVRTVPSAESCVFSTTGSEAVLAALRIARSATGRSRVIKFQGHFHGWPDPLAIGTPGMNGAEPASAGQDPKASSGTIVCRWNDLVDLRAALNDDVAAIIMEPAACNGGAFEPRPGYLRKVKELARSNGSVLIFDEVITGYRLALGGAQERYGILPDLTVLGKALGGGLPISCVAGKSELMAEVASGRVSHLGTFNCHPVTAAAAAAALATYESEADTIYPSLEKTGRALAEILRREAADVGLPLIVNQIGAAGYALWSEQPVSSHSDLAAADSDDYRQFARALLDEGVNVIPRGLLYVSTEHGDAELEEAEVAIRRACRRVADRRS